MKKNILILLALLVTLTSISAFEMEIGGGTTTSPYIPYYAYHNYGWSTFIIDSNLIGMEMEINAIQFKVSNVTANTVSPNQKIYFKHTSNDQAANSYPNPENSNYTLVYDGEMAWNGVGWQGVTLTTPFEYNGSDNLQVVYESRAGEYNINIPIFYTTEVGSNISAYTTNNNVFPTNSGTSTSYFPNLILGYTAENIPSTPIILAPENREVNVATTTTLEWELGDNTTGVDVYLGVSSDNVASMSNDAMVVDGENISSFQAVDLENFTTYYWKIRARNSANNTVNSSPVYSFTTEPGGGIVAIPIGDGTTSNYEFPLNFFSRNSVSETIYLAEEINTSGLLEGLTFYNSFESDFVESINIWVGESVDSELSSYIPPSQLTAVFSGQIHFPTGQNSINIMFDTPYAYSGGNLVVLTENEMGDYYSSNDVFFNTETTTSNRTLMWANDFEELNPETLVAQASTNKMPNITFYFTADNLGSVTGSVTDGTTGLAGVNLTIEGTNYQATSDDEGNFEFPFIPQGTDYTLAANLYAYHEATATFSVIEGETTELEIIMTMLDTGIVEGTVTSSGTAINGATISLDGNIVTTDALGEFRFTEILAGEYEITASADDYVSEYQTITVTGNHSVTVNFDLIESNIILADSFESYPDFSLTAAPWIFIDGDLSLTYGVQNTVWENTEEAMAYIVFNPLTTVPPLAEVFHAQDGSKYMACFASTSTANDDWMISQEFNLNNSGSFSFWAKSITDSYGLERFNILVSDGSTNPEDFTSISGANYVEAPIEWTQYSYNLEAYANQSLRLAIQCVSDDSYLFMVDNVEVDAPLDTSIEDNYITVVPLLKGNYPNPFNPETTIAFSTRVNGHVSLDIYNIKGQKVRSLLNENRTAGNHNVVWNGKDDNGKSVASGVFFYRMKSGKYSSTKKMILMK